MRSIFSLWLLATVALLIACGDGADSDITGLAEEDTMNLTSVFETQEAIPPVYTCDGEGTSPPSTSPGFPRTR